MVALLFIFCLILGFVTGYLYRDTFGGRKQKQVGGNNCIQIQTEEILLDAQTNKEIADITSSTDDSPKNQIFSELTKKINAAAQEGRTRLYLEYEYDFNRKIRKYLTIKEIRNYFKDSGYEVKFCFPSLGYSDIEHIDWGK